MFKINDFVGDGIIIVMVLVQVIVCEGVKVVVVGMNLMDLKCGIDKVVVVVIDDVKVCLKKIKSFEEIV